MSFTFIIKYGIICTIKWGINVKISDFLEFNSRTVRMKLDKAYFDKLNFSIDKDNKNIIINLVKDELYNYIGAYDEINYEILGKITDKVLSCFLASNIQNIHFLCKIIEENFEFSNNYYDSLLSLYKLTYIIDKAGVSLSGKYFYELIERSVVLRENIKNITIAKKDEIEKGMLNKVIKNDITLLIINVYLDMYCYNNFSSKDIKYCLKTEIEKEKIIKEPATRKRKKNNDNLKMISQLLCDSGYSSYVSFISKFSPLTFKEEIALGKRIKEGDLEARNLLVYHNLGLVLTLVSNYTNSNIEVFNLISEGNIGLIEAAEKYDYTRGVSFSVVATWWINQFIKHAVDNQSANIRIPVYKREQINKYLICKERIVNKLRHEPSLQELSNYIDMSLDEINYFENLISETISLSEIALDDQNSELQDSVLSSVESPLDLIVVQKNKEEIRNILNSEDINIIEKEVIRRHLGFYGKEQSFSDIAKDLKLTRKRINAIFNTAITKIKYGKNKERYKEFIGEKFYIKK